MKRSGRNISASGSYACLMVSVLLISIVTSCLNEEGNVEELHRRIKAQFEGQSEYDFEHIYVDNGVYELTLTVTDEGGATANDVLSLIETIQQRARTARGIDLQTEVQIVGE